MELNEVANEKLEELSKMNIDDEHFKDASNAVCNLIETQAKVTNQEAETKAKKKDSWWKNILLVLTGVIVPFVLNAFNQRHDDALLDKTLEYEKTGAIISTGGKSTINQLLKRKK